MITPGRCDIVARRDQALVLNIDLVGIDLSLPNSDVRLQVRDKPGGALRLDFAYSGGDTEIVFTGREMGPPITSMIRVTGVEKVIFDLPRRGELADADTFAWGLRVKAGDATEGIAQLIMEGDFIVHPERVSA